MRDDRNRLDDLRQGLDLRDRFGPDQTHRQLVRVYDGGAIPTTVPKVYLTHPATADAADTEGASFSTSDTSAVTIPVVVLGPNVPVAGDLLVAHAIGGRWLAGEGGGTTVVGCLPCSPCAVPRKDLAFTVRHITFGLQSGTLVYSGAGSWHVDIIFGSPPTEVIADISCVSGTLFFREQGGGNDCAWPCGSPSNCLILDEFTCTPFHLKFIIHKTGVDTDCPGQVTEFTVDDPDDPPTTCPCSNTIHVNGCNGLGAPGAAITIKDSGGTTIDSGTTDASGDFSPSVTGLALGVDVSRTRFSSQSSIGNTLSCTTTLTIGLSPASGFHCFHGCADPVPETLTMTFAIAGAVTLTYSDGQWAGSFTASGQSYAVFIDTTGLILVQRNGSNCAGVTMTVTSCPPSFAASITIGGTCASEIGGAAVLTE